MASIISLEVEKDFARAMAKARASKFWALLKGKNDDMLSFEEVKKAVAPTGESYAGCKSVRVEQIVGSEDRIKDFNKSFCPRSRSMRKRWECVDTAFHEYVILPPVKLLEIGGVYFVRDGNHRVSIAKAHDVTCIDAEVIELSSNIALRPKMRIQDIKRAAGTLIEADVAS